MDRAMMMMLAAARSRVACLSCSLVSGISRCARWLKTTVAWGRQASGQQVEREDVDGERVGGVFAEQVAGEWHKGDGEQEREVPPGQAFALPGDAAEYPVVDQPELGDDVERDHVADQLVGALAELRGEFGGRGRVGHLGGGRHL